MGMREIIFQIRGRKSRQGWGFSENQGKYKLFFFNMYRQRKFMVL